MGTNHSNYIGGRRPQNSGYPPRRRRSSYGPPPSRRPSPRPAQSRSAAARSDAARKRAAAKRREAERQRQIKLRRKRAMIAFFVVFFSLATAAVCGIHWWASKLDLITYTSAHDFEVTDKLSQDIIDEEAQYAAQMGGDIEHNPEEVQNADGVMSQPHITNILLVGTDNRSWKNSRSDTMILVSLNSKTKTIKMCSFLRDTYCDFPDYKGKSYVDQKLTHAFAYGGAGFCIETIEHNFGVKIDNYVRVNFSSFPKVINCLGGVKIRLSSAESEYLNMQGFDTFAGTQRLYGKEALAYARIRYIDSDYKRTTRHQTLLTSIATAAKSSSFSEINSTISEICSMIQTDMSDSQITSLTANMLSYLENLDSMEMRTFPEEGTYDGKIIDNMWVAVTDMPSTAKSVQEFIYG
ncbi:MAG: LytR family transcriptional regulator [Ruminococcaceae bacterium]|nr:LytR family transcriptional regulator [Oscillospiraceae bacterium]